MLKPSGLLAINFLLLLSLQTLPKLDSRGEPPAGFHTAVLPEPRGLRSVPGRTRGSPGSSPAAPSAGKGERDPTASPLPIGSWHLKFHLRL